ncbi:DUF5906 domain-containing protein [uncultured Sphingobium sp.]|uniref:DUF5906 domain-containing protein n=1 Tax=uncultured Sphingobium sp. TaxID=316087 RepID=UPI0026242C66|nr:DUF5906 domain-containing protein [uncultured Sphingobium sp.]
MDKTAVEICLSLIDPDESGLWYRILRALFFAYGSVGVTLADEWSRRGALKYRPGEPQRLFDKFAQERGFSADTLYWLFRQADQAARRAAEQEEAKTNVSLDNGAYAQAHIEDFNRDHAIVTRGSKTVAMWETYDPRFDRYSIEYLHKPAFQDRYVQRVPIATDKNGEPVVKPRGKHWFDDGRRLQYDRIVFLPGKTTPYGTLNAWRGFAVEPADDPSGWSLLKTHLFDNVCGRREDAFAYLMNWLAACVQRLGGPLGVALVLTGSKGAGKSILIKFLAYLFGDAAFVTARADDVLGRFNARLEHTLFLGLEEAVAVASKQQDGALKDLITREDLSLEDKFFAGWSAPSHIRMIMTSNNDHVVRADGRERRYAVFEVINAFDDNPDGRRRYFGDIVEQMETGGYEAMLGELQARDISAWNPERIPETEALRQQKLLNLVNDPVAAWYYSRLEDGVNILSGEADPSTRVYPWGETGEIWVPVAEVIRDCQHHAQQNGHRSDGQRIKAKLARFMPAGFTSVVRREEDIDGSKPARMFPFPPLNKARLLFQKATGFVVPGTEEEEDAKDEPTSDDG